ncbi:YveK family protein [Enterococcus lactis]|uniref:YveK family protein n=1 Tax=Enterococcus lactis TaxID=357441 RepID=UPI003D963A6A
MFYGNNLFEIINRNKKKLLFIIFLFGFSSFLISKFCIQKKYSSTVDIVSMVSKEENNVEDATFNLTMIKTYKDLVKTDVVLSETIGEMKKKYNASLTIKEIKKGIEILQSSDSQIFTVAVTTENANLSMNLANVLGETLIKKIPEILRLDIRASIVTYAKAERESFPNIKINIIVGIILGIIFNTAYILIKIMNDSLEISRDYLVNDIAISYLGNLTLYADKKSNMPKIERLFLYDKQSDNPIKYKNKYGRMNRYKKR